MNEQVMKAIIGGIFGTGTYTVWTEDGEAVEKKEKFNIRLYKDLWHTGAIKKLKGNKLHVWLTIAIHANNQAEGWPTQRTIASLLDLNKDTVTKALKELEKDGFIERTIPQKKENGQFATTRYKIKFAPDLASPKKSDREESSNINDSHQSEKIGLDQSEKTGTGKTGTGKVGHKEDISFKEDPSFKENHDDDAPRVWEKDPQYLAFRNVFTAAGADDIKKHEEHYDKFQKAIEKVGFADLLSAASKYIKEKEEKSQIVLFLSGLFNDYLDDRKTVQKKKSPQRKSLSETKESNLPQAVRNQVEGKEESEVMSEEELEEWKKKLTEKMHTMNEVFKKRKRKEYEKRFEPTNIGSF